MRLFDIDIFSFPFMEKKTYLCSNPTASRATMSIKLLLILSAVGFSVQNGCNVLSTVILD